MNIETANRLFELRKKHNLSQEELAEKLGVSRQAVSKWERSEASPDTDNLIALAKIYNLSLDELIYGEKDNDEAEDCNDAKANVNDGDFEPEVDWEKLSVNVDNGENKVKIGPSGILVEKNNGQTVKINFNGIKINDGNAEDLEDDNCDEDDEEDFRVEGKNAKFWLEMPYPIICTIAYLIFGFCNILGGWHPAWIIFVTIPVYYSLVEAIYKKRFCEFAYPVLTAVIYLVCGCYFGNWHPAWIIFVTIPVYYSIAAALDKKNNKANSDDESEEE